MEGALKTSLRSELGLRQNTQGGGGGGGLEDLVLNVGTCDDFFVDDLLNFSNEDAEEEERLVNEVAEETKRNENVVVAFDEKCSHSNNNHAPTELSLPADELANLEWLSHFVEDSFSGFTTTPLVSAVKSSPNPEQALKKPCFTTPVPAKARSKRIRTGGRVWSLGSPSLTESSSTSSSSSSSSSPTSSPWLAYQEPTGSVVKKPKRSKPVVVDPTGSGVMARRCSHCGVQKTPQWRAGPMGAKTLCNACGVRFKSGRLFPEYRPACSPTFSTELHSNHHRKVLEMRRKKESGIIMPVQTGLGPPVLSSF